MKAVVAKCPECRATLETTDAAREVRCSYCNTLVVIRGRTLFLQRAAPLPPRPTDAPEARVAMEPASTRAKLGCLTSALLLVSLCTGLPILLCHLERRPRPFGSAVLAKAGRDAREALVAVVRNYQAKTTYVAAYDASTGKKLWRSNKLPFDKGIGALCVAGDVAIHGDKGTSLDGVALADGKLRWHVRLNEMLDKLCAGDDDKTVRVVTKDKRVQLLTLADGQLRPAAGGCRPLSCDRPFDRRGRYLDHLRAQRWSQVLSGMKPETVLAAAGAPALALGYKTPGTRVPMVALLSERAGRLPEVRWQAVVPAANPLSARSGAPNPDYLATGRGVLAVAYRANDGDSRYHVTVFSLADGKRRFDAALPKKMRGLWSVRVASRTVIVTSTWGAIAAYDLQTGQRAYVID